MSKKHFIQSTLLLSFAGLLTRFLGFFYRIFLSRAIGAEGMGIYQLILPLQTLILAITTSGLQMAISRLCASRFAVKKRQEACSYFSLGTVYSFTLTLLFAVFLFANADFLAVHYFREPRTAGLIQILACSLPLSALHTCISAFYFSKKETAIPSILQFLEQLVRIGSTYLLCLFFASKQQKLTPQIAVYGALFGEISSSAFGMLFLFLHFKKNQLRFLSGCKIKTHTRDLLSMSIPLSLNRILLTLLGSLEAILIPGQLKAWGMTDSQALASYGIFSGMVLPLILFPSTVIHALSVMLLPSIAEFQALGYKKRIRYVTIRICIFTFFLGSLCCLGFLFSGPMIGTIFFHSTAAGNYIRCMSFLCPFLYLHMTLASILQGLGKSGMCLIHNLICSAIRLFFVLFSIPKLGIRGYLYGFFVSEFFLTLLHLYDLRIEFSKDSSL